MVYLKHQHSHATRFPAVFPRRSTHDRRLSPPRRTRREGIRFLRLRRSLLWCEVWCVRLSLSVLPASESTEKRNRSEKRNRTHTSTHTTHTNQPKQISNTPFPCCPWSRRMQRSHSSGLVQRRHPAPPCCRSLARSLLLYLVLGSSIHAEPIPPFTFRALRVKLPQHGVHLQGRRGTSKRSVVKRDHDWLKSQTQARSHGRHLHCLGLQDESAFFRN